jgi:hypothetical protein
MKLPNYRLQPAVWRAICPRPKSSARLRAAAEGERPADPE